MSLATQTPAAQILPESAQLTLSLQFLLSVHAPSAQSRVITSCWIQLPRHWKFCVAESAPQFCAISSLTPQESYQYKWPLSHFLEKLGVQSAPPESLATHWPEALQNSSAEQEPQFTVPPQLSFQTPHSLPSDEHVAGTHEETHWPEALQVWPEEQVPQFNVPPQLSFQTPHSLPSDKHVAGTHEETHWPEALQVCPEAQAPQ